MKFDTWSLKLQAEFELGYFEEALYTLDSYRHLLKNDKSSPEWMKQRFLNFLNYFSRILKLKNEESKFSETDTEALRDEVSGCKELIEKSWLLEKI
jgi:hypothetical protein